MYTLSLEITKRCNLACTYCYLGVKENYKMSLETAEKAINLAVHEALKQKDKQLNIYFIGGEPLLAFDLVEKCCVYAEQVCKDKGISVGFSTTINGTLLSEKIIDFFIIKKFVFKVSIDGLGEIHDKNRKYCNCMGSHDEIIKRLHLVRQYEEITGNKVHAAQVISKNTCNRLTESLKYLYGIGFYFVESSINLYEEWEEEDLKVLFTEIEKSFLYYKELKKKKCKFYWKFIEARIEAFCCESPCLYKCKAGVSSVLVTVDGNIYPCTESDETVCIGNVNKGLNVKRIREFMGIVDSKNDTCLKCKEYKHCPACQCIMVNYDLYRDFYKFSAADCKMTKFIFELFRNELSKKQIEAFQRYYKEVKKVI